LHYQLEETFWHDFILESINNMIIPRKRGNMFQPALVYVCVSVCDHDN